MTKHIKKSADDAFTQKGPTLEQIKSAFGEYVAENPDSVYDLGEVLGEEEPDETLEAAYKVLDDNDEDLFHLLTSAEDKDLEDRNDVGDLMSVFCEAVLESVERPQRAARREKTKARLSAGDGGLGLRQGRPYKNQSGGPGAPEVK